VRKYQAYLIVYGPLVVFWVTMFILYKNSKIRFFGNLAEAFVAGWNVFWN